MVELKSEPLWYVRVDGEDLGPMPIEHAHKFMLHGQIKPADYVSRDRDYWEQLHGVPELLSDEYLALRVDTWKPEPCSKPQPAPRKLSLSTNLLILTWSFLILNWIFQ